MPRTTGIGVKCGNCGHTSGHVEAAANGGTRLRCDDCGQFAERSDSYCAEHDVRTDNLPNGYTECPYCKERRDVEQMQQEMHQRRADPRMHGTVDARRF